jgi:hypothetical protein
MCPPFALLVSQEASNRTHPRNLSLIGAMGVQLSCS